jgi:hypothetical protein
MAVYLQFTETKTAFPTQEAVFIFLSLTFKFSMMQNPIRKTMLIAGLALATMAFSTKSLSPENRPVTATLAATTTEVAPMPAPTPLPAPAPAAAVSVAEESATLYTELHLEEAGMKPEVLEMALKGFHKIADAGELNNTKLITIVDFSQPSSQKRLYVVDLETKRVLFQSLVAHGRNTGGLWATSFSNSNSSHKSSPGFYVTAETYNGGNGYSLRLDGLEKNINDNARNRAIVMHGAPYANPATIGSLGFLGRSQGCPALPLSLYKPVINTIKNGTCLFIYTPDRSYLDRSTMLG